MLAAHWYYLLFCVSPSQRSPPKIIRTRSDPVKLFFDDFFIFHLIILFHFLVFLPELLGSGMINTEFSNVLNDLLGDF